MSAHSQFLVKLSCFKTRLGERVPGIPCISFSDVVMYHLKGGRGARRHGDEAAEELRVADEERDGECARVGGRDDDHTAPGLRVLRENGADQCAEEGGPVSHPGAASLPSP